MARSEAENAGTCEYNQSASSLKHPPNQILFHRQQMKQTLIGSPEVEYFASRAPAVLRSASELQAS
jgi:hypothetical protein